MKTKKEPLIFHENSQEAFEAAIASGRLSKNPQVDNYAGHYMYMYTQAEKDYFKNINTRQYDV